MRGESDEGFDPSLLPDTARVTEGDYGFLAEVVWNAIEDTAPALRRGRTWMRNVARQFCRANEPVSWIAPVTGLRVVQDGFKYWELEDVPRRVRTILGRLSEYDLTGRVKESKQVNAVAANLIHSLDAAALVLAVQYAHDRGNVSSFGVVHDCFHTLAADAAAMAESARTAFVDLHSADVLRDLHRQFSLAVGAPPPCRNLTGPELEIQGVLGAENFLS